MSEPAPTDDMLLLLLEEKLPYELTEREIDALRAALKTTPAIREALLVNLAVEHGVAERFAPELQDIEALLQRVPSARANGRRSCSSSSLASAWQAAWLLQ